MGDEHVVERARPAHALADGVHHPGSGGERQLPGGVDRREDVLGGGALLLELEGEVLAVAHQPVDAAGEADAVLLEAVAEPRLRDAHALLELEGEAVQVVEEVGVELLDVAGDDAAQQQPAEAGRRGGREVRPPERHPAGRRDRPRVEHLQLGQDHRLRLLSASDVRDAARSGRRWRAPRCAPGRRSASRRGRPARRRARPRRPTSRDRCRTARWRRRRRGRPRRSARVAPLSSGSLLQLVGGHEQLAHRLEARRPADGEGGAGRGEGGHDLVDPLLVDRVRRTARRRRGRTGWCRRSARRAAPTQLSSSHSDRS